MFREYLLGLSRGRDYLLPIEDSPTQFELNGTWHESLNQLRNLPYEGWSLIGYEEGQRRLVLPVVAEKGLSHSVPYETMVMGLNRAKLKAGVTDLVGDIHSHPRSKRSPVWQIPSIETSEGHGAFSLRDLYGLLSSLKEQRPSDTRRSCKFVAEGNENLAVFGTRGSLAQVRDSFNEPFHIFATDWYAKFGWKYIGSSPDKGEMAEPQLSSTSVWSINKAIAHHYQLTLFRGFTNGPLLRDYPRVS